MEAITLSWDNPMCKTGAVASTPLQEAAKVNCRTGVSQDERGANDVTKTLSVSFNMNQGKACEDTVNGNTRYVPCINTNKRCVTTECMKSRDALNQIAFNAVQDAIETAKNYCDPRTMYPKNSNKPEGEEGWLACKNFEVSSDLKGLSFDDIEWAWEVKDQSEETTYGYAQGTLMWVAKMDVGRASDAATLRTILGSPAVKFPETCKAALVKAAGSTDALVRQKFQKTADYANSAESDGYFEFGPGVNGQIGLRAPNAMRFGEFVEDGEKLTYTTPAPNDDEKQSPTDQNNDDRVDNTDGKFTMDEIEPYPTLQADIASWTVGNQIQWEDVDLEAETKFRVAGSVGKLDEMVVRYTELASVLGGMATTIDNSINKVTDQLALPQKADGVQDELNSRKNKLRAAKTDVQKKKTFVDGQLRNKAYEAGLLGSSGSSSTADSSAKDKAEEKVEAAAMKQEQECVDQTSQECKDATDELEKATKALTDATKAFEAAQAALDAAAGSSLNQGTLIGVVVAIVAVLLIAGAVAYLVVKKNRGGGARQYRNHPTTQQNPAYEAPKGGPQQGGQQQQQQRQQQRQPQQKKGPNVQQQGQRKVLVLDPYGNDA
jgi:hypothetical protein